jgi:HK97 gp10 family phage protein
MPGGNVIRVHIGGLAELQETLRRDLPDATARNVMKRTLLQAGQPIARRAAGDAARRTGKLQVSIQASTQLSRRQRSLHRRWDPSDVEIFIGAGPLPQAHMVEFGTSRQSAEPFMRPAWDQARGEILQQIKSTLWAEIQRAVARRAKKMAKA